MSPRSPLIPIAKAIWIWAGSSALTLALSSTVYFFYQKSKLHRLHDTQYKIHAIIQTGPEKEPLKTAYLAELLDLSSDRPFSLYAFNLEEGEKKLTSSPLIKEAHLKKIPPDTLYIDYTVRKPLALLIDYQNIAIDPEGYLFPVAPFFSPKQLPEIYLGLPPFGTQDASCQKGGLWQTPLEGRAIDLAFELLQLFSESPWKEAFRIQRIDISNAYASSLGQREIVLFLEEELSMPDGRIFTFPKILRLSPKGYEPQMIRFLSLRKKMIEDYRSQLSPTHPSSTFSPRIIDLRIPQLAFVQDKT